jgi:radical SAM-linked protein
MPEIVQRWRIVYRRDRAAADLAQRGEQEAWEDAVLRSGLPVAGAEAGRARLGFAIPLPVGLAADAERLDLPLTARLTAEAVREALEAVVPGAHAIVDLHDVWVGEPSLVSRVVAADYRLVVRSTTGDPEPDALERAVRALMSADRLERVRRKADRNVTYDLRPFLLALGAGHDSQGHLLGIRLAADQAAGVGRPDEVVLAVADVLGEPLHVVEGERERLWLADELAR